MDVVDSDGRLQSRSNPVILTALTHFLEKLASLNALRVLRASQHAEAGNTGEALEVPHTVHLHTAI